MKNVMVDIESLGNCPKEAMIVSIGAVYFDQYTGELGREIELDIDARDAERNGAKAQADTVLWWLSQSNEARQELTRVVPPRLKEQDAICKFDAFIKGAECIWSHATFDHVLITGMYNRLKFHGNISYRAARDIRTLVDLANSLSGFDSKAFKREGVHHKALDDAKFQVKYVCAAIRSLKDLERL